MSGERRDRRKQHKGFDKKRENYKRKLSHVALGKSLSFKFLMVDGNKRQLCLVVGSPIETEGLYCSFVYFTFSSAKKTMEVAFRIVGGTWAPGVAWKVSKGQEEGPCNLLQKTEEQPLCLGVTPLSYIVYYNFMVQKAKSRPLGMNPRGRMGPWDSVLADPCPQFQAAFWAQAITTCGHKALNAKSWGPMWMLFRGAGH